MPDTTLEQWLHDMRKEISTIAKLVREQSEARHVKGGAEITLAWRSLQQAKMWLGMSLGENQVDPLWEKDGDN